MPQSLVAVEHLPRSSCHQDGMIEVSCGIDERGFEIVHLKIGKVGQNRVAAQSSSKQIQDIGDPNAHASNTGATTTLLRIDGDSLQKIGHRITPRTTPADIECGSTPIDSL